MQFGCQQPLLLGGALRDSPKNGCEGDYKYIRVNIFVLLLLISSFSSLLAYNVFVLVFCNFFIYNHKPISKKSSLYAIL